MLKYQPLTMYSTSDQWARAIERNVYAVVNDDDHKGRVLGSNDGDDDDRWVTNRDASANDV